MATIHTRAPGLRIEFGLVHYHNMLGGRSLGPRRLGIALFFALATGCSAGEIGDTNQDAGPPGSCSIDVDCTGSSATLCCGGKCVDPLSDAAHCGSCAACPAAAHATAACTAGKCAVGTCDPGFGDCDKVFTNGCEVSTDTTVDNCGACGTKCSVPSGTAACEKGKCAIAACSTGRADCNGKVEDGCETDLRTDVAHCGSCATPCTAPSGTEISCVAGACFIGACKTGFGDCDGDGKGCETDLGADAKHCGTCGTVCAAFPHAAPKCGSGACVVGTCDVGFEDCDKEIWNGCETAISSDPENCGACGKSCPTVSGGKLACVTGACGAAVCTAGFADCDTDAKTGCEVTLSTDAKNCGLCGNVCPAISNGTPGCAGFKCGIGTCDTGYDDCFGGASDGCETSLLTNADHCSACGKACAAVANGTRACAAGACKIGTCNTGYDDCDGSLATGCESKLAEDPANCSKCGTVCPTPSHGAAACKSGTCGLGVCDAGWANCDGDDTNGCEFNVATDPSNCGGCGIKCGTASCSAGACVCSKKILIIPDDSPTGTATLATALTAAGYTVTTGSAPSYLYNGTNPALTGFGSVVVLAGGPTSTSYTTDMPSAGQTALTSFVSAGNGLVLTEWAAYQVASGRWATLAPLVLLNRTTTFTGTINVAVDPARPTHPIWAGLPTSFTFSGAVNVGKAKTGPNLSVIGTSPEAFDLVVLRDAPAGRVVHFAGSGNYLPTGWNNTNVQKLIANAAGWAARCN